MRPATALASFLILWPSLAVADANGLQELPELPERERRWLTDEVAHLITDYERAAYLSVADHRDRGELQASFWEARDPSPETRRNERLDRDRERGKDVERLFGERRGRAGRETARGRLYLQLGAPAERRLYPVDWSAHPIEDWLYEGADSNLGLPPVFHVIWHRPDAADSYAMYDPAVDGPERLAVGKGGKQLDRQAAVVRLAELSAELGALSGSLLPGSTGGSAHAVSGASSHALVLRLRRLHNSLPVDLSYVARVLAGDERRKVEHNFASVPVMGYFHGALGATSDTGSLHYALQLPSGLPTLKALKDGRIGGGVEMWGRFLLAGSDGLRGGQQVASFEDRIELKLDEDQIKRLAGFPLAIEDVMAFRPGRYRAQLVLRDLITGAFGVSMGEFEVPEQTAGELMLGPLLIVARDVPAEPSAARPFSFGAHVYYPAQRNLVTAGGELTVAYELGYGAEHAGKELRIRYEIVGDGEPAEEFSAGFDKLQLPVGDARIALGQVHTSLRGIEPGSYRLRLHVGSGDERATREQSFTLDASLQAAHPIVYVRKRNRQPTLALVQQALAVDDVAAAQALLERGAGARLELQLLDASLHHRSGRAERAIAVLEGLKAESSATMAAALYCTGKAYTAANANERAVASFERLAELSPRSARAWNALAEAVLLSGDLERALLSLKKSLAIDPDQRDVSSQIAKLERQVKRPR